MAVPRRPTSMAVRSVRRAPQRGSRLWVWTAGMAAVFVAAVAVVWALRVRSVDTGPSGPTRQVELAPVTAPSEAPSVPEGVGTLLLTDGVAQALVDELASRGFRPASLQDATLATADRGFAALDPAERDELGRLFRGAYARRPTGEQAEIEGYLGHVRGGVFLPAEQAERGRRLLASALGDLQPAMRQRLQVLFGAAVEAGMRERRAAEERGRLAIASGPLSAPNGSAAPVSPPRVMPDPVGDRSRPREVVAAATTAQPRAQAAERGEDHWRGRVAKARADITAAETRLARADAEAKKTMYGTAAPPTESGTCNIPDYVVRQGSEAIKKWSCTTSDGYSDLRKHGVSLAAVEAAKADLERARTALADLEEEARRAGALPGWLR